MTANELLGLLNLKPPQVAGNSDLDCQEVGETAPASETALRLDDWSMRRGRELLEGSTQLQSLMSQTTGPEECDVAAKLTADFHGAAFELRPELADRCKNERLHTYMRNLMDTPEFKALHQETQLDVVASEIATLGFAEQWVELAKKKEPEDEHKAEMQAMLAAGKALDQASQDVADLRDAQMSIGLGQGSDGKVSSDKLLETFRRVRNSNRLRNICNRAGRYRRFAQAKQRKKVLHGRDDMVGVVMDGDIGRLLPSELAMLGDPELELQAMRRIVERQALCRDYRGVEKKAKGPIVVVVDESGSMDGEPIYDAKAIALALYWVAKSQNRWVCMVGFSGGTEGTYLAIPPNRPNEQGLLEWLEHFYGGGTTCDVPLVELPAKWEALGTPKGKTDMIVITDAAVNVPRNIHDSFVAWKKAEQVKLITLVIGAGNPGTLGDVSDQIHLVPTLSLDQEAVGEVLGI